MNRVNLKLAFLCFIWFCVKTTVKAEYNFTNEMASKCKEYYCRNGYDYVSFFRVRSDHKSPGVKLELHFAIKGIRDGHVLMSSTAYPKNTDSVYEIVIGAGGNTYSELRRMRKKFGKVNIETPSILSTSKFSSFWIKISDDGLVEFGKEGEDVALIGYKDPMPLEINYFSFASWSGVELKVLYDCPTTKKINGTETAADSLEPVPSPTPVTPIMRLKTDLLKNYSATALPPLHKLNYLIVIVDFYDVRSVTYDVTTSKLTTHVFVTINWEDSRLKWKPSDYEGLKRLFFRQNEIWEPEMMLYNSTEIDALDPGKSQSKYLTVGDDGVVTRALSLHVTTWCNPSESLVHWPRDKHECFLDIGSWSKSPIIRMSGFSDVLQTLSYWNAKIWRPPRSDYAITNEWSVETVTTISVWVDHAHVSNETLADISEEDRQYLANVLRIGITMSRKSYTYTLLYFSPFVAVVVVVLSTFWTPVSPSTKMLILGFNLVFVAVGLSEIMNKMPSFMAQIPNIVKFYLAALVSITISIVLNVIIIKLTTEPKPWPCLNQRIKRLLKLPMANSFGFMTHKNVFKRYASIFSDCW